MEKTINVRREVVNALPKVLQDGGYANIVLQKELKAKQYSDVDRRFFTELFYGVLRRLNYLDAIIVHFTGKKINKLKPLVANSLRIALYQIIYLDKVPNEAAVHESVAIVKKAHFGLHSFVNGVLRNVLRKQEEWSMDALAKTELEKLSLLYNEPLWLVEELGKQYPPEVVEDLCAFFNQKASLTARWNTLKGSKEELAAALTKEGVTWKPHPVMEEALIIEAHEGSLHTAKWVQDGLVSFMDVGALAIAHIAHPKAGDRVLDVCAAPGGKTMAMAAMMNNEGYIKACDIHEHKLALMKENATRLGASIVEVALQDGTKEVLSEAGTCDVVLCDVPCSGWGILQKKLDMRWRKTAEEAKALPTLQLDILRTAAKAVKAGGVLVYATCTLHKAENEGVVEAFLQENSSFSLEPIQNELPWKVDGPMVTLLPTVTGTDGFFMARLRKHD